MKNNFLENKNKASGEPFLKDVLFGDKEFNILATGCFVPNGICDRQ